MATDGKLHDVCRPALRAVNSRNSNAVFDFSGAEAKLARAVTLHEQLKTEVDEYTAALEGALTHVARERGLIHSYLIEDPQPLPSDWALVVGDIAHNARTALDHAAWQLVFAAGGTPDRRTAFPLLTETPNKPLMAGLPEDLYRAVEGEQPYIRGGEVNPARLIHELDRIDKHRILLPTVAVVETVAWSGIAESSQVRHEALISGGEVARLQFAEPVADPGMAVRVHIRLHPNVDAEVTAALPEAYVRRGDLPHWALGVGVHYIRAMLRRLKGAAEEHVRGKDS